MTEEQTQHMPAQLAYFESPSHPLHSASGSSPMSLAERKRIEERKTQEGLIVAEEARLLREELSRFQAQMGSEMRTLTQVVRKQSEQLDLLSAGSKGVSQP